MTFVPGIDQHLSGLLDPLAFFRRSTGEDPLTWQESYLREIGNVLVLKGRQIGASTGAGSTGNRRAVYVPGSLILIVSPSLKQSTEVKNRAKSGLLRLGERLVKDSASELALENGSRILSLPGSAKSVRGWSADLLIIDEAAFIDQETFLAARATVAATGGRTIVQSTPEGPFGHFYDMWASEDASWSRYKVRSDEVSTVDMAFLEREQAELTEEEYAQEYLAEFTTPGLGLIDQDRLTKLTRPAAEGDIWAKMGAE